MRHYEIVLLIHPDQSEQVPAMLDRYKDMVTAEKGLTHRVEDWGRRRLAYLINDVHKAHYVMLNVECNLETLRELEKNFKFNDSIVRSLVIRRDRAVSEQSALAKAKAEEDLAEARAEAEKQAARDKPDAGRRPARTMEPAKAADDVEAKAQPERDDKQEEKQDEQQDEPQAAQQDPTPAADADKPEQDKPEDKPEDKPAEDKPEPQPETV